MSARINTSKPSAATGSSVSIAVVTREEKRILEERSGCKRREEGIREEKRSGYKRTEEGIREEN